MASKLIKEPSFCFIAPTAYLQDTLASSTHLVLAHLVDKDPLYASFYKDAAAAGDFIMMDNSAYELKEPYAPEKLVALAAQCGAHAVVLPDYPFQPGQKTINAAVEFIPTFKAAGLLTFFVPQSEVGDLEDWIAAYKWASNNPDIDIIGHSILGVPNALDKIEPAFSRVVMSSILLDRGLFNHNKHNHFLGLNAGPGLEIPSLIKLGVLDTIDSSGPIWSAILGHEYSLNSDSLQATRKINFPVDFGIAHTKDPETIRRIRHNISHTINLFNATGSRVWYAQE
jgi:hypothetical protein